MTQISQWFVDFSGQIFGPFHPERVSAFITEGRIIAGSLLSQSPQMGFRPARLWPEFADHFSHKQSLDHAPLSLTDTYSEPLQATVSTPHSSSHTVRQNSPTIAPHAQNNSARLFLIMADIRSGQSVPFLQALQALGPTHRLSDHVWVLAVSQTAAHMTPSAQSLRNQLSQSLTRDDRLFITENSADQLAWFNMGSKLDQQLQALAGLAREN